MKLLNRLLIIAFIVFWMFFIFVDYWQKHPSIYFAFKYFDYWGLSMFLILVGAGVVWSVTKFGKKKKGLPFLNGLSVFGLAIFVSVVSVGFSYAKVIEGSSFDVKKAGSVFVLLTGTALAVYIVTAAGYVAGSLINRLLKVNVNEKDAIVIDIASGFMGLALFMFLLGAVSMLYWAVILPVLIALFSIGRKQALFFIKKTLWEPISLDKKLNLVGTGSFYLLLCLMCFNFTAVNVPMPAGFDALTLYANLPSLISQHHALVEGFQPYNWSLLMSLGHILFDSTAVSLAISWLGGTLSLYAMYVLCRNWLKMDVNFSAMAVLVFALSPAFTIQASAELKVDLGLLFVYISILILALNYFKRTMQTQQADDKSAPVKSTGFFGEPEIILMGLLTGFSLGIKLTTVFFAFALVCALWYVKASNRGFFAAFLFCLFLVFLLKIDDFGGLRQYHIGVDKLQWGVLLAAVFLMAGIFIQNKKDLQNSIRTTAVYGLFVVLPFLPWLVKNYAESRSLSPQVLLNGIDASPAVNLQLLEQNVDK